MGWFSDDSEEANRYNEYQGAHKASISHELLAAAASFEAAKAYEDHVAENGQPDSHAMAKELLAGFTGAFIDREVETHGLDYLDSQKAKHEAKKRAERAYETEYE